MPYKTAARRTPETQMTMRYPEQMYAEWIWAHFVGNRLARTEFAIHARHLESLCPEAAAYLRFILLNASPCYYKSNKAKP